MAAAGSKRLLFVCMGNICRSPTAEGVMRSRLADRGLLERIEVASAGTIGYHAGAPPDARMRRAAARRGYRLDGRARRVTAADFGRYDLILAMDRENLADLVELRGGHGDGAGAGERRAELRLFGDFLLPDSPRDVPDPYYGGERGFETVLDLIEEACPAIIDHLLEEGRGDGETGRESGPPAAPPA